MQKPEGRLKIRRPLDATSESSPCSPALEEALPVLLLPAEKNKDTSGPAGGGQTAWCVSSAVGWRLQGGGRVEAGGNQGGAERG